MKLNISICPKTRNKTFNNGMSYSQLKADQKSKKGQVDVSNDEQPLKVKKKPSSEASKPIPVSRESKLKPILMSSTPGVTLKFTLKS